MTRASQALPPHVNSASSSRPRKGDSMKKETADGISRLCAWASTAEFGDMPQAIRRRAALVLVDDVAAIVAARDEPEVRKLQDGMLARPGIREATVFRG